MFSVSKRMFALYSGNYRRWGLLTRRLDTIRAKSTRVSVWLTYRMLLRNFYTQFEFHFHVRNVGSNYLHCLDMFLATNLCNRTRICSAPEEIAAFYRYAHVKD